MKFMLVVMVAMLALTGCGASREVSRRGGAAPTRDPQGQERPEPAVNRRVVLFEPRSNVMMILVNAGHGWRKTLKGRQKLAMGRRGQTYKVLGAKEMDALLESFENRALGRYASEFVPGDEQYFASNRGDRTYRGILYLEEGRRRRKVLSFKPHGEDDLDGHGRLRSFVELKGLVYRWYNARTESENPTTGVTIFGSKR